MRRGDLDRLAKDIEPAVEDAPLHVQATVQQYIDCSPTIDPIRAAGGCRCGECERCDGFPGPGIERGEVGICTMTYNVVEPDGWCKWGKLREAKDDG